MDAHDRYYQGVRMRPYDIVKELTIAFVAILVLTLGLSFAFSSPDLAPLTIHAWAKAQPVDFVTTATGELAGATTTAGYGAPYNTTPDAAQTWGPLDPQDWGGVHQPIDAAQEFVLGPLTTAAANDSALSGALSQYSAAGADQQAKWLDAYTKALDKAQVDGSGAVTVPDGDYGPVPEMNAALLQLAQSGSLDGTLQDAGHFYNTDYTRSLMFMGDGNTLANLAGDQHLLGDQWGMMNETGSYPGQSWLWLYTMWYQVFPFNSDTGFLGLNGDNADLGVVLLMGVLTLGLALVPFIPVLRDIPRWIPVHRLIWRRDWRQPEPAPSITPAHAS